MVALKVDPRIQNLFDDNPIYPDSITLDPEDGEQPKRGRSLLRALDGFFFVKDGHFVYPTADKADDWWTGVEAYGYTATLTGDFKYFIWAGQWDYDYEGKHWEVVRIKNLTGLEKNFDRHWRGGHEMILWLETKDSKSYALLQPDEVYDSDVKEAGDERGNWRIVTNSWTSASGCYPGDPAFVKVEHGDEQPDWWPKAGKKAWNFHVREGKRVQKRRADSPKITLGRSRALAAMKTQEEHGAKIKDAERKRQKRKENQFPAGRKTGANKRKRESEAGDYGRPTLRKRKAVNYAEVPSSPPPKGSSSDSSDSTGGSDGEDDSGDSSTIGQEGQESPQASTAIPHGPTLMSDAPGNTSKSPVSAESTPVASPEVAALARASTPLGAPGFAAPALAASDTVPTPGGSVRDAAPPVTSKSTQVEPSSGAQEADLDNRSSKAYSGISSG